MSNNEGLLSDLVAIVGKENTSVDIFDRISYGQDAFGLDLDKDIIPIATVRPRSAQGVSEVLEYANKHKIPVYIHGRGTSFKGSARPKYPGSVILSTEIVKSRKANEH